MRKGSPRFDHLDSLWVTSAYQNLKREGGKLGALAPPRWPPLESPLGQSLVTQPEALAIIHQYLDSRLHPVAKDEGGSGKGVGWHLISADPHQPVNSLSKVDGLSSHQDPHVWGGLNHESEISRRRNRLAVSTSDSSNRISTRRPLGSSMEISALNEFGASGLRGNSRKS